MEYLKQLLRSESFKKITLLVVVGLALFLMKDMIDLILLTFLFSYLFYNIQNYIFNLVKKVIYIERNIITVGVYIIFLLALFLVFYKYIPVIIKQLISIYYQIIDFNFKSISDIFGGKIGSLINGFDIHGYVKSGGGYLFKTITDIGKWSINLFLALILSLFFILEKDKITKFAESFKTSKISGLYTYMYYFGHSFLNSFGKVMQAQITIAFVNSTLSIIMLSILGFPQILGLGVMIFVCGLVPVAGVIVSLIPLCIIAFTIGGFTKVLWILVMIAILHALESYILNPKLMSAKTKLPIFITFVVLIVSEHFMGVWGLLIGIPLFVFLLDILDIKIPTSTKSIKIRRG